jgi:hypothetical protein
MTIERAFHLIHLLDVPETKRKFWPQWSCVVVNRAGQIEDVIQHFEVPDQFLDRQHMICIRIQFSSLPRLARCILHWMSFAKKLMIVFMFGSWNRKGNVE